MFSNSVKIECVLWYSDSKSPRKVRRKFKAKYGRNKKAPDNRSLKIWYENFRENGSISIKKNRNKTIGIEPIIQFYENDPKQSLRRVANQVGVSHSTVRRALKFSGFKVYRPQVVQEPKNNDKIARIAFAEIIHTKTLQCPNFIKRILFSDEAVFHLQGGVNIHNSSHWSKDNPHWIIEKSLNLPKVMVWAAIGRPEIIGPFFIEGNVGGDKYLETLKNKFILAVSDLQNASEIIFMQDGAPPHSLEYTR